MIEIVSLAGKDPRGIVINNNIRIFYGFDDERDKRLKSHLDPDRPAIMFWQGRGSSFPYEEWEPMICALAEKYPDHDLYMYAGKRKPPILFQRGRVN